MSGLGCGLRAIAAKAVVGLALSTMISSSSFAENVKLTLWTIYTNDAYKKIITDFEQDNPGITIQATVFPTNQSLPNLQVAATNRTLPDIFFEGLGATLAHKFIDQDLILNLDEAAKAGNWDKRFLPVSVDLLKWRDKWWEVPATTLGMGLFYRKDIFAANGIEVPTTFEAFEAACATLKAAGITPVSMGGKGSYMTMRFVDALIENFAGPQAHDALYGPSGDWTAPAVVKAFTVLKEWTDKGYFTKGFLSIEPSTNYVPWFQGRAAMVFEGAWEDSIILNQKQDMANFGFFLFPSVSKPERISAFAQGWMISKDTKHPAEALKFVDYITSAAVLNKYVDGLEGPLANMAVKSPTTQPNQAKIKDYLSTRGGYLPTDQRFPQEMVFTFFQHQDAVVAGTETPAEATAAIQAAKAKLK